MGVQHVVQINLICTFWNWMMLSNTWFILTSCCRGYYIIISFLIFIPVCHCKHVREKDESILCSINRYTEFCELINAMDVITCMIIQPRNDYTAKKMERGECRNNVQESEIQQSYGKLLLITQSASSGIELWTSGFVPSQPGWFSCSCHSQIW